MKGDYIMIAIYRSFHPDLDKCDLFIRYVRTESEAQAHCSSEESRVKGVSFEFYIREN